VKSRLGGKKGEEASACDDEKGRVDNFRIGGVRVLTEKQSQTKKSCGGKEGIFRRPIRLGSQAG